MNPQNDPFAAVRVKARQPVSEPEVNNSQVSEKDPFDAVRIKKSEQFPGIYETGRHAARLGSRIAETIGGIPGDISSLLKSGLVYGLEKLGKKITPEQNEELEKLRKFPTSSELKKFSEEKTKGFTSAQNETEKFGDEVAETIASLLGPMKFRKALGVGLVSNLAKEGIKLGGLGEGAQEAGKLGTMFLATMYNPKGALNYASSQYEKANQLSKGASINSVPLETSMVNLVNSLKQGVTTPAKNAVIKPAEEIIQKAKGGKILVQDLTAAKRDLNTLIKDPILLQREKKLLKNIGHEIDKAIRPYEKLNPAFSKAYRPANEIYGAVMQGSKASEFIKKTLGMKSFLGTLVGEALLGHPELILPTASAAGGAFGAAKTFDFFTRLAKSPELQKFYGKAMVAAAKEDSAALRLYAEKIENELNKDQSSLRSKR